MVLSNCCTYHRVVCTTENLPAFWKLLAFDTLEYAIVCFANAELMTTNLNHACRNTWVRFELCAVQDIIA